MKSDPVKMTLLFDFYGELLTERQKEFFDLYHNSDLSLSEIAENAEITRQGVRDVLSRAEGILTDMEAKLKIVERFIALQNSLGRVQVAGSRITDVNDSKFMSAEIRQNAEIIKRLAGECSDLFRGD